jgi:hypothetical protein
MPIIRIPKEKPTPFLTDASLLFVRPVGVWDVVLVVGVTGKTEPLDTPAVFALAEETATTALVDVSV